MNLIRHSFPYTTSTSSFSYLYPSPTTTSKSTNTLWSHHRLIRIMGWSIIGFGIGLGVMLSHIPILTNESLYTRMDTVIQGTRRSIMTFTTVAAIMIQYKWLYWRYGHLDSTQYKQLRSQVHLWSAHALLWLCRHHGGIYNKAAQHLGSLVNMVPKEYTDTLAVLQDKAPFHSYDEVCRVFLRELGGYPTDFFLEFDQLPLAAASLAQVHRAVTLDGRECAVKVQYEDVVRNVSIDLKVMNTLTKLVKFFFPEFNLGWIVKEFDENLQQEFDFRIEANNARSTAERFTHRSNRIGDFHVPKIFDELTSKYILTMEYINGTRITDVTELIHQGFNLNALQRTLIDVFSEMVFVQGFVHCDPHPGNMLVRWNPNLPTVTQLVLLDHGLYRKLDESFRYTYCDLWVGILTNNDKLLESVGQRLGTGGEKYWRLFPFFFAGYLTPKNNNNTSQNIPAESINTNSSGIKPHTIQEPMLLGDPITEAHKPIIRESIKQVMTLEAAFEFIETLPRDMLLVMRTINLVSGVHRALGGTNRPKFRRHAYYAVMGRCWPIVAPNWLKWYLNIPTSSHTLLHNRIQSSWYSLWNWMSQWTQVWLRVYIVLEVLHVWRYLTRDVSL